MPVIGTPVAFQEQVNPLYLVPMRITQVYEHKIPTKRRAVVVRQSQTSVLQMHMLNDLGNKVDLEPYDMSLSLPTDQIQIRFQEAIGLGACNCVFEETGNIEDAYEGLISFSIPDEVSTVPGVYTCEAGIFDINERMHFSNQIFIIVERGLFRGSTLSNNCVQPQYPGGPTVDEIRMSMRDNGPEDNRLLDDYEFDAAELAWGLIRSVQFWNTAQPPIRWVFDTITYPFRDLWLDGVCGQLFEMASTRYMRNDLQYSAGGLSVADQAKWQQYQIAAERRWGNYTQTIKAKKVTINMEEAMGSLGSPYGWYGNY